jgi:ABC-type polysaccharide/polyol phosphate export permease
MANEGTGVFIAAAPLIGQLRISYTMLACALVWRNLISFGHNFMIYVVVCLYAGVPVSWSMPLIIPGLALVCLNGIWIAMLLGLIAARFRDVQQLVATLLQVALFITPIFWAPTQLTGVVGEIEQFNLLYHYVELVRAPMLGQAPGAMTWAMVIAATILGWGATIFLLSRFRRRIPYWL